MTVREALVISLQVAGHSVVACEDGAQAIAKLVRDNFDLVVCDLLMPKASGLAVLHFLKSTKPTMKAIVVTGAGPSHQKDARAFGADRIFLKPLNLEMLNKAVAELVGVKAQ